MRQSRKKPGSGRDWVMRCENGMRLKEEKTFSPGGRVRRASFSDRDFRRVKASLKIGRCPPDLCSELCSEIEREAQNYLDNQDCFPQIPRISEVRAVMQEIHKLAKTLLDLLNDLDDRTFEAIALTSAYKDKKSIKDICRACPKCS